MENETHKNSRNPGDFSLRQRPKRLFEIEEDVLHAVPLRADPIHASISQEHFLSTPHRSPPSPLLVQPMKHHAHVLVLHLRERQQLRRRRVRERLAPPPRSRLLRPQNRLEGSLQRRVGQSVYASPLRSAPTIDRVAVVHSQRRAQPPVYASAWQAERTERIERLRGERGVEKRGEREDEAGGAPVEGERGQLGGRAELQEIPVGEGGTERLAVRGGERENLGEEIEGHRGGNERGNVGEGEDED